MPKMPKNPKDFFIHKMRTSSMARFGTIMTVFGIYDILSWMFRGKKSQIRDSENDERK